MWLGTGGGSRRSTEVAAVGAVTGAPSSAAMRFVALRTQSINVDLPDRPMPQNNTRRIAGLFPGKGAIFEWLRTEQDAPILWLGNSKNSKEKEKELPCLDQFEKERGLQIIIVGCIDVLDVFEYINTSN